jgi:hypothetical protein
MLKQKLAPNISFRHPIPGQQERREKEGKKGK